MPLSEDAQLGPLSRRHQPRGVGGRPFALSACNTKILERKRTLEKPFLGRVGLALVELSRSSLANFK